MWERAHDYFINRLNWSLYMLLVFTGLALMPALPYGGQVAAIPDGGLNLKMLFVIVYIVIYGIVAMNLGQLEGGRLKPLIIQLAFALFITTPYWIIFKTIIYASWLQILWGMGHLFIYGLVLGLFGLLLAMSTDSEISHVKYVVFAAYLLSTLFIGVAHPLSPFHMLASILGEKEMPPLFFLKGYGALALIGAFLLYWIRRKMARRSVHGV